MKIFLDTEFTGLHQKTTLISLAMVAEAGEEFYAEFTDYDKTQITPWIKENVIKKLDGHLPAAAAIDINVYTIKLSGTCTEVVPVLKQWLARFEAIEIWADVLAYDWVLFCELFGGVLAIPENIFFAPFDLTTLFRLKRIIEPVSKYEKDI